MHAARITACTAGNTYAGARRSTAGPNAQAIDPSSPSIAATFRAHFQNSTVHRFLQGELACALSDTARPTCTTAVERLYPQLSTLASLWCTNTRMKKRRAAEPLAVPQGPARKAALAKGHKAKLKADRLGNAGEYRLAVWPPRCSCAWC